MSTTNFRLNLLGDNPIISVIRFPELGGNVNGPSLIKVPPWVPDALGKYYLYFAHHEGESIRLAYADSLQGPWTIHQSGALGLAQSGFVTAAPLAEQMDPEILQQIEEGIDGDYPHIASPDVHIDQANSTIVMYFHGRVEDGTQHTRVAVSRNGLAFECQKPLLGKSYLRIFSHQGQTFGISLGGSLYRSVGGITPFTEGPRVTSEQYRHGAIIHWNGSWLVAWTRAGDKPERVLLSTLDTAGDWQTWRLTDTREIRRPEKSWEGADEPLVASRYGGIMEPAHQLRDPCFYTEDDRLFLLYAVAGEQGIAIGELTRS